MLRRSGARKRGKCEVEEEEKDAPPSNKKHRADDVVMSSSASSATSESRDIAGQLLLIEGGMSAKLGAMEFGAPITHIYNPLHYASQTHSHFVGCYGNGTKKILFVGMNPGPFGMAQNGVAFGDTQMVKEWLKISGEVKKPAAEHPSRVIQGLACSRSEVSGSRFWGFFRDLCKTPEAFFSNCYVHNYCPLCFMTKTGKNVTPPSLKVAEKSQLQAICDGALLEVIRLLEVEWVVGVGKYVADRAKAALKENCTRLCGSKEPKKPATCCGKRVGGGVETFTLHSGGGGGERVVCVCSIMHPSPINPAANKGWAQLVQSQLSELGLLDLLTGQPPT